ncbi:MAG: sulfurtransferase [Pseudobdellovibrionaceae bacterium]
MKFWILLFAVSTLFVACKQVPTKVYQSQPVTSKEAGGGIVISEKTVILDARPAFEYSLAHLNGAIHLRPEDFNQKESPFYGLLDADHFALARRLARLGITPETPVVVVGKGPQGYGEEGRMAWTLKYLGVKDVKFAAQEHFSLPLSTAEAPPKQNAPIWKPSEDETLQVSKADFLAQTKKSKTPADAVVIIDVRSSSDYLGKGGKEAIKTPDIGAINIPWTEFFTAKGLVNPNVKSRLESIGITAERKIFVIAWQGFESAAVTLALRDLGYSKAANFSGGYLQLSSRK